MHDAYAGGQLMLANGLLDILGGVWGFTKVLIGFSIIIFFHELGHFLAAKWVGVRVDRFAVGFGPRLIGYRRGEGLTIGGRPDYKAEELKSRGYGETDYCLKALPLGGYVKMLGQDDVIIDEKTGAMRLTDDPRAFNNHPVGKRMIVVSAGVVFNLVFAALLVLIVYMLGVKEVAPAVGEISPDSPAYGILQPGDRILEVNGRRMYSIDEVGLATVLSEGPLSFKLRRGGDEITEQVPMSPIREDNVERLQELGLAPPSTNQIGGLLPIGPGSDCVKSGDRVVAVNGAPVREGAEVRQSFLASGGKALSLDIVRHKDPRDESSPSTRHSCQIRPRLAVLPTELAARSDLQSTASSHILGMQRRVRIVSVTPNQPAAKAGFKVGDVMVEFAGQPNPVWSEMVRTIRASGGRELAVVVDRAGQPVRLSVTPSAAYQFWGPPARATVGLGLGGEEEDKAIVARVADGTPAHQAGIPAGAELLSINGAPVANWFDVSEALFAAAGKSVPVRFRTGPDEVERTMTVPSSIVNELSLPPGAVIVSIDGTSRVNLATEATHLSPGDSRLDLDREHPLTAGSIAVRALLRSKVGRTVDVTYVPSPGQSRVTKSFTVRADNIDAWQMRIRYESDTVRWLPELVTVQSSNPLTAAAMATRYTVTSVQLVYLTLTKLLTRRISADNIAGPIGIVTLGMQTAEISWADLFKFLAMLSANLAVINFLPVPIMDGGQMVFLILEKLKGRPLSLKHQMISTLVGLVALVGIGIFVTIQDIQRFWFS